MANPKRPPLFKTTYQVGSDDVSLRLVIGEKQFGSSLVRLDGTELTAGATKKYKVGKGSDLAGSRLTIKSVVTDTNDLINRTSITIHLEGGTAPATHTLSVEVDENGDSAIYRAEVNFAT